MAKLSAHGKEIGTVYGNTDAKRYMSDGKILKNIGFGWKLYATCKAGVSPVDAFQTFADKNAAFLEARPCVAAYRKELHALAGMSKRWKLHAAVQTMPDDADGVWSEVCDGYGDNISADVDDIGNLCRLYLAAISESKAFRELVAA